MIVVIGAGSGKKENLTLDAFNAIKNAETVVLKTEKMPIANMLNEEKIPYITLDHIYEESNDFDELNKNIKDFLINLDSPVYVVHGSGLDDTSVRLLQDKIVLPGVSLSNCALAFLNISTDAKSYTTTEVLEGFLPSQHTDNIITCIDSDLLASEVKCILAEIFGDEYPVIFYTEDFDGNQEKKDILLYELDMQKNYNHTTSIYIKKPDFDDVYKYDCLHLLNIMEKLCSKDGCPWDSTQTHVSLRPYLIEEAYEVLDAINKDDIYSLYDELGDVLFSCCNVARLMGLDAEEALQRANGKFIERFKKVEELTRLEGIDMKSLGINELDCYWQKAKII